MRQVCALLAMPGDDDFQASLLDVVLNRPFPAQAVSMSCGLGLEYIDGRGWSMSILDKLYDTFAAVHPTLMAAMERLAASGGGSAGTAAERSAGQPAA